MQNTPDDIPEDSPEQPFANADIDWQEGDLPYSTRFDDIYFSRQGGLAETEHVFLAANRLRERWQQLEAAAQQTQLQQQQEAHHQQSSQRVFTIAELGFGTGLNFLCCWRAWHESRKALPQPGRLRLHYIACEKYPMRRETLAQALQGWEELSAYSSALIEVYPDHSAGYHRLK